MRWNDRTKKAASLGVVALLGWASGTWLPPEVIAQILGAV